MNSHSQIPLELQEQELETLVAIYDDAFLHEPVPPKAAWGNPTGLKEFGIRVTGTHPGVDDKSPRAVSVVLVIKYSKSYPKTAPTLSFTSPVNITSAQLATLSKLLNQEAHKLAGGGVFVFELIDFVQVWMTSHVKPPPAPDSDRQSLLVEMAKREAEDRAARLESTQLEKTNLAQQAHQKALNLEQKVKEHKRLQSSRQAELAAASTATDEHSSADNLTEITFPSSSSTYGNGNSNGGGAGGIEGTFRLFGGVREKLWTVYLAIPVPTKIANSSSSSSLADLAGSSSSLSHPLYSVTLIDFPTPYYSASQGAQKLAALAETMRKKLLGFRGDGVVPILSVMLVDRPGKGGKRLGLLTGRVGRGERLRGVLKVCGRLEMGVAKDHLIQVLAGLEAMRKEGITHDDICLDTVVLSSSSGGARLSEPCYRKRIIDLDRSNPFLESEDLYLDDGEAGDEKEIESLPWNWLSPDEIEAGHTFTHKRDVWNAGVTFLRMLWGADVIYRYPDLEAILDSDEFFVPEPLADTLRRMFEPNPKERWSSEQIITALSTLDLGMRGVLRPSLKDTSGRTIPASRPNRSPLAGPLHPFFVRKGGNNQSQLAPLSRYRTDFEEVEFLGEGGFGKVVKARNRLDGRFYAIKKIKLRPEDNEQKVFREVNALSRLNHQYIVRYFTCWLEEDAPIPVPLSPAPHPQTPASTAHTSAASTPNMSSSSSSLHDSVSRSPNPASFDDAMFETNFDDFLSVRGHQSRSTSFPSIHFGGDEDEESEEDSDEEEEDDEDESTEEEASRSKRKERELMLSLVGAKTGKSATGRGLSGLLSPSGTETSGASTPGRATRVLYIQMEYVENQTLKEAIARGLSEEESWRLFRQILEALRHMTELGIVHRDLKPSNLLIDHENRIKIGDFGLAATDFAPSNETTMMIENTPLKQLADATDLTSGIGTSLYIAPEVEMSGKIRGNNYDGKADLYSLGIIFFEMCFPLSTGMERAFVIRELRNPSINFPSTWNRTAMPQQTKIIDLLLQHNPAKRPRVVDLLSSGLLPSVKEDDYFLEALRTFGNPASNRYPTLITHIFGQTPEAVKDFTFDDPSDPKEHRVYEALVKDRLIDLFRRHGAIDWEPPLLLPVTDLLVDLKKEPGARFLNRTGQLVELPYDGLVSFARHIARTKRERLKRYHFGVSFRESMGGQPVSFGEVAYDILSPVRSMASEAEIMSVLDKIIDAFPGLTRRHEWEFHITHQAVTDLVLAEVPSRRRLEVCDILREIGPKVTFAQIRSKLNLPRSVTDRLEKWSVSEPLDVALDRLFHRFPQLSSSLQKAVKEIREISDLAVKLGVKRPILFHPFLTHRFFKGGALFECVRAHFKREVLGVGGRYDNLIEHFRLPQTNTSVAPPTSHIALERIAFIVGKHESAEGRRLISLDSEQDRSFGWTPRRCDVYVGSFGEGLMDDRVEIVGELWGAGLRADLMYDDAVGIGAEEVMAECLAQGILFLVITKGRPLLKVRSVLRRTEDEVYREDLLLYLRSHVADQRRIDFLSSSTPHPNTQLDLHHRSDLLLKSSSSAHTIPPEQIKLLLPGEKGVGKEVKGAKKLHRHGTKALYWEKARTFLTLVGRSPLQLFALDAPTGVLSAMTLETGWLLSEQEGGGGGGEHWKAIRDRLGSGYASAVREELREAWGETNEGMGGGEGGGAVWLFSVREEKGFLLQWPVGKH